MVGCYRLLYLEKSDFNHLLDIAPCSSERLGIQDLHTIKEDLWDGRTKWSDIGGALKVDPTELEAIARHGDPAKCFGEMLSTWLKGAGDPPRTWTTIVKALRGKIVDLGALADEIEAKYKLGTSGSKSPTKGRYFVLIFEVAKLLQFLM